MIKWIRARFMPKVGELYRFRGGNPWATLYVSVQGIKGKWVGYQFVHPNSLTTYGNMNGMPWFLFRSIYKKVDDAV